MGGGGGETEFLIVGKVCKLNEPKKEKKNEF